jgi:cell division septum initiation protein DivIVA
MNINGNSYEDFMVRAKEVEEYDNLDCRIIAADCIRQLADRIAELEKQLNNGGNPEELNTRQIQDARTSLESTPPYAYGVVIGEDGRENVSLQFDHPEMCGQKYNAVIPLYTTPQIKPLSDKEIHDIRYKIEVKEGWELEFSRAIEAKVRGEK